MGCRYCVLACPYDSRQFLKAIDTYYPGGSPTPYEMLKQKDFDRGTVVKCDFCAERLAEGRLPACVETCPAQARHFGDLDDPESEVSRLIAGNGGTTLREELGTKPSVYYIRG
jgi:molybdopterin-containing oxidoreductase family iron-sulfur binding subunit